MKNLSCLGRGLASLLLATASLAAQAQTGSVGIGTTTPNAAAALDISSTSQGLLLPRLTLAQRTILTASPTAPPVPGLVIYQTDNTPGLYAYDGTAWGRQLGQPHGHPGPEPARLPTRGQRGRPGHSRGRGHPGHYSGFSLIADQNNVGAGLAPARR